MATGAAIKWSQAHTDAHDALVSMGIPKKEAQALVEGISGIDSGEILSQALQARGRQNKRLETPRGAPRGAVPLNAPQAGQSAATAAVAPAAPVQNAPPPALRENWRSIVKPQRNYGPPVQEPAIPASQRLGGVSFGSVPGKSGGRVPEPEIPAAMRLGGAKRPAAPSAPEAQLTPPPAPISAQTQPAEKPRFRVPLVSYPTPAPLGGSAPTPSAPEPPIAQAPSAPPAPAAEVAAQPQPQAPPNRPQVATPGQAPDIYTLEEYAKLAPGTLFRWMGEGAHRGRLFIAHMNPTAPRQQVFGKAPQV